MSLNGENKFLLINLSCIIILLLSLIPYNIGLRDGVKQSDNRVKQLEAALKIHSIEIPKEIHSE